LSEDFFKALAGRRRSVDDALRASLPVSSLAGTSRLNEALTYAVFPGGKRLRPVLALLASELAGARRAQGLAVACAVEFLHSSSLILDDLPCMDDADLRRNRRALHLAYGEGVAVLAAVALLNKAYVLLAEAARASHEPAALDALMAEVARCVGADGMVGGQVIDLELRAGSVDAATVACRDLKTVALMRLMMTAGALACGATEDARALGEFGECFGRAYQVCDDLLDGVGGGHSATGKPAHQDARHARATNVAAIGAGRAGRLAAQLVERGLARLDDRFGEREEVSLLAEAAGLVLRRAGVALSWRHARLAAGLVGSRAKAAGTFHT
jgi:geranylgeranyl pyrophosphate synthase